MKHLYVDDAVYHLYNRDERAAFYLMTHPAARLLAHGEDITETTRDRLTRAGYITKEKHYRANVQSGDIETCSTCHKPSTYAYNLACYHQIGHITNSPDVARYACPWCKTMQPSAIARRQHPTPPTYEPNEPPFMPCPQCSNDKLSFVRDDNRQCTGQLRCLDCSLIYTPRPPIDDE